MKIIIRKVSYEKVGFALWILAVLIVASNFIPSMHKTYYWRYQVGLLTSLFFFTLSDLIDNEYWSAFFMVLGFGLFGSLMAFRNQTAIDDYNYYTLYQSVKWYDLCGYLKSSSVEKGFLILNYIGYHILGDNYNAMQVIYSYLPMLFWGLGLRKSRKIFNIPVFMVFVWSHYYFLIMGAGLIRIFIAISIAFYALTFLWEDDWKKYTFLILFASTFHLSSLILLLFLAISIKYDFIMRHWKTFIFVLFVIVPIAFAFIARYIVPFLGGKYAAYASMVNIFSLSISLNQLDMIPVFILGVFCMKYINQNEKVYTIGLVLIAFSVIVSVFSSFAMFGRLGYYGNLGVLIISAIIAKQRNNKGGISNISYILLLYAIFYMMHTGFLNPTISDNLLPYDTFLGN